MFNLQFVAMVPKSLLKDLPIRLEASSVSARTTLLDDLRRAFDSDGKPAADQNGEGGGGGDVPAEMAAKGLSRILPNVLIRYNDSKSRTAAFSLLQTITKRFPEECFKPLVATLHDIFASWNSIHPTLPLTKVALAALSWTSVIAANGHSKG